jgi:hypothetical protein
MSLSDKGSKPHSKAVGDEQPIDWYIKYIKLLIEFEQ